MSTFFERSERTRQVMWVLWPSFLLAAVAEFLFFSLFDPADLHPFGVPIDAARLPVYTLAFFFFWALTASASALTVFLSRSPFEVNRYATRPEDRPEGSPEQDDGSMVGPDSA